MSLGETPTLEQVIRDAFLDLMGDVNTSMPAIVESYDSAKQKASVRPAIMRKFVDGEVVELPVISNVPVVHPRAGAAIIHVPLKKGDTVHLVFSQRSLDKWANKGGVVDPEDPRRFQLQDAVAFPGGYAFTEAVEGLSAEALTVKNDKVKAEFYPDGRLLIVNDDVHFELKADGSLLFTGPSSRVEVTAAGKVAIEGEQIELVDWLDRQLQAIIDARTMTMIGPQPLIQPLFATLKAELGTMKE